MCFQPELASPQAGYRDDFYSLEAPLKALVYHGPGQKSWDTVEDPAPAEPTDIVVRIDTTTICGTDLHILKGDVPAVVDGRILGHEAVGTVAAVGSAVTSLAEGDRVLGAGDHIVRAVRLLQARDAEPLPGCRRHRVDLRASDRRHPG